MQFNVFGLLLALTIQPSSWRSLITSINPELKSSFSLCELTRGQLTNSKIINILIIGYIILPLASVIVTAILLYGLRQSMENTIYGITFSVVAGVLVSLIGSLTTHTGAGILIGSIGSISSGLAHGIESNNTIVTAELSEFASQLFNHHSMGTDIGTGYWAVILSSSVAAAAIMNLDRVSLGIGISSRISSIIFGSFVGACSLLAIVYIISSTNTFSIGITIGIFAFIATFIQSGKWLSSLLVTVIVGGLSLLGNSIFASEMLSQPSFSSPLLTLIIQAFSHSCIESTFFVTIFALPYAITKRLADETSGAIAGLLGSTGGYIGLAISSGSFSPFPDLIWIVIALILGLSTLWWLPIVMYPITMLWNSIIYSLDRSIAVDNIPSSNPLVRLNSSFWNEIQYLPLFGLDSHLVMTLNRNHEQGSRLLEQLNNSSQRWAVREAQIELDALNLENRNDIQNLRSAHQTLNLTKIGTLENVSETVLYSFNRISSDIDAALNQSNSYNQRLSLTRTVDLLGALLRELNRTRSKYAARFAPIVINWLKVVNLYIEELQKSSIASQEIISPYIVGIPIGQQQSVFVGRTEISRKIEKLLVSEVQSPPILLYGQRRMGKTSLLNNFGKLLTSSIVPMFVDLQGPASSAKSDAGFLYGFAKGMAISAKLLRGLELHIPSLNDFTVDPFIVFDEWLDNLEETLPGRIILIALDEFEVLEKSFTSNRLNESEILGLIRNIIQHRTHFRVLLSGSNTLDKFKEWSNYLINAKVVKVSYLNELESRQLIENPVNDFKLSYDAGAVEKILQLTCGHPYLIQLLCDEVIVLKNEQPLDCRWKVSLEDVEEATESALEAGSMFFYFMQSQFNEAEVRFLKRLARKHSISYGSESKVHKDTEKVSTIKTAVDLDIIYSHAGTYTFQIELVRRWFSQEK